MSDAPEKTNEVPVTEPAKEKPASDQLDERSKQIFETIGKMCKDHGIEQSLFIAVDPETNEAIIYHKGDRLSAAKLGAHFTRIMKSSIMRDLDV